MGKILVIQGADFSTNKVETAVDNQTPTSYRSSTVSKNNDQ